MSKVIGIDPGVNTGIAVFEDSKLVAMHTMTPDDAIAFVVESKPDLVVCEDSRLTSHVFSVRGLKPGAALKVARDVGRIDQQCGALERACEKNGIGYDGISPRGKGRKIDAKTFERVTGWVKRSNQHERDAVMVAWHFRNFKE